MFDIYRNKKIILTGHTGFKGSWLAAWLQTLGAEVVGISLKPQTNPSHFDLLKLDMPSYWIDIRDAQKIKKLFQKIKPDVVFHLAAQALVRVSYDNPIETFETNVMGTAHVLEACRNLENLKAVVAVTSDKCYENKEWSKGYQETDPMGGYDPYSASKGCSELVVSAYRRSFFPLDQFQKTHQTLVASARGGNVIGGGDWAKDRLIPDLMRACAANETVVIRSPSSTRPWQHVLDCLSGYLTLGEKLLKGDAALAEAWNFGPLPGKVMTVLEIVQKAQQLWPKLKYQVVQQTHQPHEAHSLTLDITKARSILKWSPKWDVEESMVKTIEWYQKFYVSHVISTFGHINEYQK